MKKILLIILLTGVFACVSNAQVRASQCSNVMTFTGASTEFVIVFTSFQIQQKTQTVQIVFERFVSARAYKDKERGEFLQLLLTDQNAKDFLSQTWQKNTLEVTLIESVWRSAQTTKFIPDFDQIISDASGNKMRSLSFKSLADLNCKPLTIN